MQVLSFVIGSLDTYNQVILHFASGGSMQLDGYQIVGQGPNFLDGISGDQLIAATNGRVFFDTQGLDTITGFELRSLGANAFEIDNISIAAPEPATWGMMILAAGMAGVALRRRRTRPAMA
ncbi:PEP-CTERM sorting domain-containing protein [Polymorphobacter fuscus]|uniref:PEP-CTERM sorting domain-containing protein n=2 Tax=Sandarakinorhabdus fusca TaxID=1439888 RepID=A0A7C9KHX8_9SPHN|nr:PEP-CTERM sorting domain-containing protein [Polymorphobacter fuscus]MQT17240.1 PEP-CTERM sorting domain-containing protein [Polymorphobacter fuscus]